MCEPIIYKAVKPVLVVKYTFRVCQYSCNIPVRRVKSRTFIPLIFLN